MSGSLRWAAQAFGDDADWSTRMAADANGEECEACGRPVERGELEGGLCNVCQCRAEEHAIACRYAALGMGFRSY
jgi:methionyl-tRNA synthetase